MISICRNYLASRAANEKVKEKVLEYLCDFVVFTPLEGQRSSNGVYNRQAFCLPKNRCGLTLLLRLGRMRPAQPAPALLLIRRYYAIGMLGMQHEEKVHNP